MPAVIEMRNLRKSYGLIPVRWMGAGHPSSGRPRPCGGQTVMAAP
jgi:hypothetical protein